MHLKWQTILSIFLIISKPVKENFEQAIKNIYEELSKSNFGAILSESSKEKVSSSQQKNNNPPTLNIPIESNRVNINISSDREIIVQTQPNLLNELLLNEKNLLSKKRKRLVIKLQLFDEPSENIYQPPKKEHFCFSTYDLLEIIEVYKNLIECQGCKDFFIYKFYD